MKRIFIVFSLLLALGVSAPMANAADSFDVNKSLAENLADWTDGSKSITYLLRNGFNSPSKFDVTLLYSDAILPRSASLATDSHSGFSQVRNININVSGDDLFANFFAANMQVENTHFYMFTGKDTLSYEWNGNLIDLVPGTVFMGFCLGQGCEGMDMIVAITPAGLFPTPVPAAVWLLGSGIAGLAVLRRKMA